MGQDSVYYGSLGRPNLAGRVISGSNQRSQAFALCLDRNVLHRETLNGLYQRYELVQIGSAVLGDGDAHKEIIVPTPATIRTSWLTALTSIESWCNPGMRSDIATYKKLPAANARTKGKAVGSKPVVA